MIAGFLYPSYRSFKAIHSKSQDDNLLMYWIIYGLSIVLEFFFGFILTMIPLYFEMKILFVVWLQLPQTQGAKYLYLKFIEPVLTTNESAIDHMLDNPTAQITEMSHKIQKQFSHSAEPAAEV